MDLPSLEVLVYKDSSAQESRPENQKCVCVCVWEERETADRGRGSILSRTESFILIQYIFQGRQKSKQDAGSPALRVMPFHAPWDRRVRRAICLGGLTTF